MIQMDQMVERLQPLAKEIGAHADEIDERGQWPERGIRLLQKHGFGGLCIPSPLGGMGAGLLGLAKASEMIGAECASTAMCFGMHAVASAVIAAKATSDQKQQFLSPIIDGKHLTTLALSEPGTGSHFYFPETLLSNSDNGSFQLNGKKSFVTNGEYADSMVVSAVTDNQASPAGQFSCLVVEKNTQGVNWLHKWDGIGMRGNSSQSVILENIHVKRTNLLGEEGDQIWYVFEVVAPYFLTAMAGTYLGIATAALNEAISHLKQRQYSHSGSGLSDQPVLQHKLGVIWSELQSARQLVYHASALGDQGDQNALPYILSAKAQIAETGVKVTNEAMTLMGGIAYAQGGKLARHLRDMRASHVMAPTTDILRTWTGRALLEKPLLGE